MFLRAIKRGFQDYKRYRQTVSELSALSNRDLADLGISRADIERVAAESVY